jgi:predicted nucleic acid-binding protein
MGELEASGKMIGFDDLIVGATARERGSEVATFNKRHVEVLTAGK